MLSATSLGDAPISWPALPVSVRVGEFALVAAPTLQISTLPEGGFINQDYSPAVQDAVSNAVNGHFQFNNLSIADILSQGTLLFTNSTDGTTVAYSLGTDAFVPRVIFTSDADGSIPATGQALVIGDWGGGFGREGGTIRIESILSPIKPGVESRSKVSAFAKTTFEAAPEAKSGLNPATFVGKSSTGQISGEWARAAVFEIAGGEPTPVGLHAKGSHRELRTTTNEGAALGDHQPVSSIDAARDAVRLAAHTAAAQRPVRPLPVDATKATSSNPRPSAVLPSAAVTDGADSFIPIAHPLNGQLPAPADGDRAARADAQPSEAAAAAFDQIGAGSAVLASPSTEDQSLGDSIGTMPLLLMLALERVAPRNWRRHRSTEAAAARHTPNTV